MRGNGRWGQLPRKGFAAFVAGRVCGESGVCGEAKGGALLRFEGMRVSMRRAG